eukprot:SAG11_NODE_7837_length_1090_cov_1.638749_1_plen_91_part_10
MPRAPDTRPRRRCTAQVDYSVDRYFEAALSAPKATGGEGAPVGEKTVVRTVTVQLATDGAAIAAALQVARKRGAPETEAPGVPLKMQKVGT